MSLRVLICRVEQEPVVEEVTPGFESLQKVVGGYLECLTIEPGIDLWCNEEGRIRDLPLNRRFAARAPQVGPEMFVIKTDENLTNPGQWGYHEIHGDFFLARADAEGSTTSLTDEDIQRFTKLFGLRCANCGEPLGYAGAVYCGATCAVRAA
jgi:hypothetical protein